MTRERIETVKEIEVIDKVDAMAREGRFWEGCGSEVNCSRQRVMRQNVPSLNLAARLILPNFSVHFRLTFISNLNLNPIPQLVPST